MKDCSSFSLKEYAILDPPIKFGVLRTPRMFLLGTYVTYHLSGKAGNLYYFEKPLGYRKLIKKSLNSSSYSLTNPIQISSS